MSVSMKSSALALAAVLGAVALVPSAASAQAYGYGSSYQGQAYQSGGYSQPYGYNQGYGRDSYQSGYRDRCETLGQGRTGAGALIGAGVGAVAGSQVAGRGNRTEGSIIGGVLGALVGSQVGRASNDDCYGDRYQGSAYAPQATYYDDRGGYNDRRYDSGSYDNGRYDNRRYDNDRRDRRYDDRRSNAGYQVSADGYYFYDPRRGWLPR